MLATTQPLIWPLLNKLRPMIAYQRRPKAMANQRVYLPPVIPWDDIDRPGPLFFGQVEGDPRLWDIAPWNFALCAIGVQQIRLQNFKTNPRAAIVSEQRFEPAGIRPLKLQNQVIPKDPPPRDDRKTSIIIWPLLKRLAFNPKRIVAGSPINLQAMVRNVVAAQQNPKAKTGKPPPKLPWVFGSPTIPAVVHARKPLPATQLYITGVSRDSAGAPLGGCTCTLFRVSQGIPQVFTQIATTTSDGSGNYSFLVGEGPYRVTFDLDGAPVRAGLTLKTLGGII